LTENGMYGAIQKLSLKSYNSNQNLNLIEIASVKTTSQ